MHSTTLLRRLTRRQSSHTDFAPQQRSNRRRLRGEQLEERCMFFATSNHEAITETAFRFLNESTRVAFHIETAQQDTLGQFTQSYHFDGNHFLETSNQIRAWYDAAVAAFDPDNFDENETNNNFGKILHAIQDFYSHTNWVEMQEAGIIPPGRLLDDSTGEFPQLTPYSFIHGTSVRVVQGENLFPFGPDSGLYRIPDTYRVYVSHFIGDTGEPGLISGAVNPVLYGGDDSPDSVTVSHGGLAGDPLAYGALAKDSDSNPLFTKARDLAIAQTQHELKRLYNLIKDQWGEEQACKLQELWARQDPLQQSRLRHVLDLPLNDGKFLDLAFVIDTTWQHG